MIEFGGRLQKAEGSERRDKQRFARRRSRLWEAGLQVSRRRRRRNRMMMRGMMMMILCISVTKLVCIVQISIHAHVIDQ